MKNLLCLHGLGCGGDTISLLNAEDPDLLTALEMLDINIAWHPSISLEKGDDVRQICADFASGKRSLDLFIVEGAVPTGPDGSGRIYEFLDRAFIEWVRDLASVAEYTIAVGTCAASGGIPSAAPNPAGASGLQFVQGKKGGILGEGYRSRSGFPVINIPGCPSHPDWILESLYLIATGKLLPEHLDYANRPAHFFNSLAHHACPRNEFYEFKASAEEFGQMGCLFEHLGCRGTQCESDCNIRLWLGRTGSCTRAGYPCISCTSQNFPLPDTNYFKTETIAGIPKALPKDVPKAWYIGMVGLAKMATPERLKVNAISAHNKYHGKGEGQ